MIKGSRRFFLTQETERQTLPFGEWFFDRKRKNNEDRRKGKAISSHR